MHFSASFDTAFFHPNNIPKLSFTASYSLCFRAHFSFIGIKNDLDLLVILFGQLELGQQVIVPLSIHIFNEPAGLQRQILLLTCWWLFSSQRGENEQSSVK